MKTPKAALAANNLTLTAGKALVSMSTGPTSTQVTFQVTYTTDRADRVMTGMNLTEAHDVIDQMKAFLNAESARRLETKSPSEEP